MLTFLKPNFKIHVLSAHARARAHAVIIQIQRRFDQSIPLRCRCPPDVAGGAGDRGVVGAAPGGGRGDGEGHVGRNGERTSGDGLRRPQAWLQGHAQ